MLDDGRLTDGHGRTVDFKNTVVIMTSNIAGQLILSFKGQDYEKMKEECLDVMRQSFRPEFLNRVDEIVVFHPLQRGELRRSSISSSNGCASVSASARSSWSSPTRRAITSPSAVTTQFMERGRSSRMIQRELETTLGRKLISGEVRDGSRVKVDAGARGLESRAAPRKARRRFRAIRATLTRRAIRQRECFADLSLVRERCRSRYPTELESR